MSDVAFVVGAYGVVLGALLLYGMSLRRRKAAAARRLSAIDSRRDGRPASTGERDDSEPRAGTRREPWLDTDPSS